MGFERRLDDKAITRLLDKNTEEGRIYASLLMPAIMKGQIFMAIRVNRVDFYVGGNCFMSYSTGSFKANRRIFRENEANGMLRIGKVFPKGWEQSFGSLLNQCCSYHTEGSDQAERKIMQSYFPVYDRNDPVIILDREIRINNGNGKKCDWLLYDTGSARLKFVEVKISSNAALKKHRDGHFDVIDQLEGYSSQYKRHAPEIVKQYRNYVSILNELLSLSLPLPEGMLDTQAGLAIFGDRGAVDTNLVELVKPFIGAYQPAISASIEEIWTHFAPPEQSLSE